jgi:rubrerythrin
MLISALRGLLVRTVMPFRWKRDHHHAAQALKRFGDVEADSAWQYLRALRMTDDVELRRMLFENVIEELKHSDLFYGAAHSLAARRIRSIDQARTPLIGDQKGMAGFLAFAHVSEKAIHGQFDSYAASCSLPEVAQVFCAISADEAGHESEARAHLERVAGTASVARRAIWAAHAKRGYESWMRLVEPIGGIVFLVLFGILFLLLGPLMRRSSGEGGPVAGNAPMPSTAISIDREGDAATATVPSQ